MKLSDEQLKEISALTDWEIVGGRGPGPLTTRLMASELLSARRELVELREAVTNAMYCHGCGGDCRFRRCKQFNELRELAGKE